MANKMSKSELIDSTAANLAAEGFEIPKTQIDAVTKALAVTIANGVATGNSITIPGFGTFKPTSRAARIGRNPQTGEEMPIPASKGIKLDAAKSLKEKLNA